MYHEYTLVERIMRSVATWLLSRVFEKVLHEFVEQHNTMPAITQDHPRYIVMFSQSQIDAETDRQLREMLEEMERSRLEDIAER